MKNRKLTKRLRANNNRIVRMRNKKLHEIIKHASWQTGLSYQLVFEELMDMLSGGYLVGENTPDALFERLAWKINSLK